VHADKPRLDKTCTQASRKDMFGKCQRVDDSIRARFMKNRRKNSSSTAR
jgi:hypothetical protein